MTAPACKKSLLTAALFAASVSTAFAAPQSFYADQLSAATPQDTRDQFLAGSTSVQSEGFETAALGIPAASLSMFGGQGALSQGALAGGTIKQGNQQNGRFNTTPNCNPLTGCKWWETAEPFEITLNSKKSAFAFFATDLGDAGGAITLDFWNDTTKVRSGIAVTQPTQTSGQLFFGWIDDTFSFNRVTFNVTQTTLNPSRFDFIGFDDVLAGVRATTTPPNPTPVSAPASITLVALGLGLMAATRSRRGARANKR